MQMSLTHKFEVKLSLLGLKRRIYQCRSNRGINAPALNYQTLMDCGAPFRFQFQLFNHNLD